MLWLSVTSWGMSWNGLGMSAGEKVKALESIWYGKRSEEGILSQMTRRRSTFIKRMNKAGSDYGVLLSLTSNKNLLPALDIAEIGEKQVTISWVYSNLNCLCWSNTPKNRIPREIRDFSLMTHQNYIASSKVKNKTPCLTLLYQVSWGSDRTWERKRSRITPMLTRQHNVRKATMTSWPRVQHMENWIAPEQDMSQSF